MNSKDIITKIKSMKNLIVGALIVSLIFTVIWFVLCVPMRNKIKQLQVQVAIIEDNNNKFESILGKGNTIEGIAES